MSTKQNVEKLIADINQKAGKKMSIANLFGSNVFNDSVMKKMLPKQIHAELKKVQAGEAKLTLEVANVVAEAMKDWAISKGASHYTHWFQPLTGKTAEKHDSFLSPNRMALPLLNFLENSLFKVNRMHPLFLQADYVLLLKLAVIRHGTAPLLLSLKKMRQAMLLYVSPQHFVPIMGRL